MSARADVLPRAMPRAVAAESPWKLGGLSVVELAKRVRREVGEDDIVDRAAGLSYYFLFALFPALLFLATLLGFIPVPDLLNRLIDYVQRVLPGDAGSLIRKTLAEIIRGAHGSLLSLGVLGALWAGSNGMGSIITALNVAYEVEEPRPWWRRRLLAIGLTLAFSALTITALVFLVFGGRIGDALANRAGLGSLPALAWNVLQWPAAATFALLAIALVYYLAPAVDQRWYWVTPGAAFTLVAWLVMSGGLRLYVTYFGNYNATYGSIGGVILLMLWLYLSGLVLLIGAELNSEIQKAVRERAAVARAVRRNPPVRPPTNEIEADVAVAGRVVEAQIAEIRRRGWTPYLVLAGATILGLFLSRRSLTEVVDTSAETVRTGLSVATAIAALERFRDERRRRASR
jgi:membrane protein